MTHCLILGNGGGLSLLCALLGMLCGTGCGQIRYSVPEELERGSFVGNIAKDLGLEPRELGERGVRIVSRGRTQLFSLNPRSGSLVTADRIDREELCAQNARCVVEFNILVEDKLKIFEVEVEIKDVNDNAPNFLTEALEVKISELTVPGTRFPLKTAFDPDVGMNSLQGYKLSPNDYFSLAVNSLSDGATYPELVLEQAIDREKKEVHQLDLTAYDGGDPVHSGNLCIQVIVLDANDNPPVFMQPEYHVSIQENVPVGTRLVTVNATDPDEGFNAQVSYILDKMPGKIAQVFDLNSATGDITIVKNLDYEDAMFYEIKIEAQDGPGLLSRAKILVTVLDVNDNAPEVTITSLTGSVPEEAPAGREIALINVHDRDSGQNGQVAVFVLGNLPFNLEKSIGQYYRLVTAQSLDREQVSEYNITLRATDGGNPPLSTETHIPLHVADINDNPPIFSHASYSAYIPENNPRGASIFSVTAQDPDSDKNARITYSLTEDTHQGAPLSSYITINSNTGVLYALRSFDYEEFSNLQLLVTASDSGNPPLSTNVSMSLFLVDQNDNIPEILYPTLPTDGSTGVELAPRSAEPGYLVTKVVAVDRDSGQNAWLSYRLLKASEPGLFVVGLHTGEVRTARALLDRDALKQSLVVAVQDHGQPPLSATVTLTIAVADSIPEVLADLGSIRTPAGPDDSDLTLYLVVAVATVSCVFLAFVIVLLALRLRRWHRSRLLQAAASNGLASMPASHFVGVDGVHAFLQTYSHEISLTADSRKSHLIFPQPNYADTLISQESCGKSEPFLESQDLLETKGDSKLLEVSYFLFESYAEKPILYPIPEELAKGSWVGNLAKDLGLSIQELPARKLRVSAEDYFHVSMESGDLFVSSGIDREKICGRKSECALEFESVTENPMSIFHVVVAIQDFNDNAPRFIGKSIELEICESASPGVKIPLDSAQDADAESNSLKMYTISPNQHFSLSTKESPDGSKYPELLLEKPLDREHQSSHHSVLTAVDGGDPPLSSTTQIQIRVTDANDNAPVFSQDLYRATLWENTPPGTSVLQVVATDQDVGENAEITYAFLNAPTSTSLVFDLNSNTGDVTTNGTLDFEERSAYLLGVEAKDGGVHTAHCNVQVEIVDENDNAPEVIFISFSSQIPEDSSLGTIIALIKVKDKDSGLNGLKLVIDKAPNRENTAQYNITITATDKGKPSLSSRTRVTLHITDVNDNAPVFQQTSYVVHVAENNPPGVSIAQLSASDPDLGPNGHVSYAIVASDLEPRMLASYVSVNAQSGVVLAQRAFDHEQRRAFQLTLQARDQGSPALGANVSLRVLVGDRNDNAPRVLHPALGPDGAALFDTVPRAAEPGYLVTKVVAVDGDAGRNAWLSYHVLQASDPGLFSLGLRTGEVRTARALGDRDAARHRLLVAVRDGGQPPLSATATLHLVFTDSLQEVLPDLAAAPLPSDSETELQFYLVVALALISVLFFLAVTLAIALRLRSSSSLAAWGCFQPGLSSKSGPVVPSNCDQGTLSYSYNLCVSSHSAKTEFNFLNVTPDMAPSQDLLCDDPSMVVCTKNEDFGLACDSSFSSDASSWTPASSSISGEKVCQLGTRRSQAPQPYGGSTAPRPFPGGAAMAAPLYPGDRSRLLWICIFMGALWEIRAELIRYSVPEELENGSEVGNVAEDLGLEPRRLAERGVRIVSGGRTQLFALNPRSGSLVTAGRIDREDICDRSPKCVANLEILLEDKVKIFEIEVEITDVNDNSPVFGTEQREIKVVEIENPGTRFPLPEAFDPDLGVNSVQRYELSSNGHFSLDLQSGADGIKYPELVLERALDREEEAVHHLVLTAFDGGDPIRSGTVRIHVVLVDTNDNAPVFTQPEYHVSVRENLPIGTRLLTIKATDPDEGANGEVTYSFRKVRDKISQLFQLNSLNGDITILGDLDYEDAGFYDIDVEAHDGPGLRARSKVLVTVLDVNDNAPEVTVTSLISSVQETSSPGTVIALFNVHDSDSGQNGLVTCSILDNLPFRLEKTYGNYHRLLTQRPLDREEVSEYNITITATDQGTPPLSTETHISLKVMDANDNPPAFTHASYSAYIEENNPRGASILAMTAQDPDSGENAQITYSLAEDTVQGAPLSSYVSINSNTGVLYALRSFDYEQFRDLQLLVTASDSGNPPLSTNVSMSLFVLDQNDNKPEILYPTFPTDGSTGVELAPRSAEPGYLVTKVVAVDRDSGQNAWLSYRLLKASEPGLFVVGLHTGEVRTARALLDRDALKQSLVVAVQDHGQPPLSATVTLTIAVADSIPEVLADLGSIRTPAGPDDSDLTLYLVVAVATVSCVFLAFVIVLLALRLRRWHHTRLLQASSSQVAGVPASHFVGMDGVQAFLQTYSHEISLTSDSRKSHLIFPQPNYADTLISQESCEKSEPLLITQDLLETKGDPNLLEVSQSCNRSYHIEK
ncbi:LOW QUALITY PROTEIN: uncharacterized protein ACOB6Z_006365 [Ctenodactylus gundi]